MDNIIEVKNLNFGYEENNKILKDVSFAIKRGSYSTILGHNGSGKSTIAKLLIGLLEKSSGHIIVDSMPLDYDHLFDIRNRIGIVFQNPDNQFIGATVQDDIAFGLENLCIEQSKMQEIINEYAAMVHMEDFLLHEPTKLSGGQKQRVAIAGVMAMNPAIIILDEATSMLDPLGKKEINELVKKLNKENNITVISITHDIEEANNSDQVILLHDGVIQDIGAPKDILNDCERLEKLSLDVPFTVKLSNELRNYDVDINGHSDSKELVSKLCQLNLKK